MVKFNTHQQLQHNNNNNNNNNETKKIKRNAFPNAVQQSIRLSLNIYDGHNGHNDDDDDCL